ncbi:type I-E CRISPR-associated protein Cse2/CasB [Haloechinothrix sp. YIM 98757]|uniref:Type I-E CRISPR-associated protein Cse2/CasB n=1 Tax=Haloechinothrix aidingensis TaxID=2752311 RepID=A0A838ADN2_9PSEU|nr:type I-E CRISPR-associated protein Cse2/CasB [Haloechinothrix aidingensis]
MRTSVLSDPGRRAAMRRALGVEPGHPRTFHAYREIARFLPSDNPRPAEEHALLTVGALMCAQPRQVRDSERAATATRETDHDDESADAEDSTDGAQPSRQRHYPSLGSTLAYAAREGAAAQTSVEKRLFLLCRNDVVAVHRQLPGVLTLLRPSQITINWEQLVCDLAEWDERREEIAARWLREFYRNVDKPSSADNASASEEDR